MENIKSCELCHNPIIKTEGFENVHCDEKQNLKIFKNLDITVSKDAKICSNCVNVSHLTYNFKMSCLTNNDHLKTLIHPGIKNRLILEEVVVEETKSEFKNEKKVCRFCLNFSEVNSLVEINLEQDVVLKDMLQRCLPEIDTNMVQNPLICSICRKLLENLFNFISQCKDTEVLRNLDTKTDVLVNENTPTVANNDDNIDNSIVKEENCECIKNPELQIKSEDFDINEDDDSINLDGGFFKGNCVLNEREIQVRMYSCAASNKHEIVRHKKDHKDRKRCLGERKFVCDICSYQTAFNSCLKQHYIIHKEPSEANLFKCNYCSFATKWKNSLRMHAIRHKNPSELPNNEWKPPAKSDQNLKQVGQHIPVEEKDVKLKPLGKIKEKKFACDICSFQTTFNSHLKRHYLVHKKPSEVNLFKCDYCPFATKWKNSIMVHTIRHKIRSKLPKFKCNDCPYETIRKPNLVSHVLVHKTPSQVGMYKCKVCPFQTNYRCGIRAHEEHHQVGIYTCDKCNFKSKFKHGVMSHLRCHKWTQPAERDTIKTPIRVYRNNTK